MNRIRILADDLTGALDTAAAFSGNVPVYIGSPPFPDEQTDPISVVATPTRDVPPATLSALLEASLDWFTVDGLSFKKVDSLLRGNTFDETAWIFRHGQFDKMVFAPAFPAQGRITKNDRQWIVRSGGGMEALGEPLQTAFARLGLHAGEDRKSTLWTPEVLSDEDLDQVIQLAEQCDERLLWVGSAGLGCALARRFNLSPQNLQAFPLDKNPGPTLLVSASFQSVLKTQWATLRAAHPVSAFAEGANEAQIKHTIEQANTGAPEAWFDLSLNQKVSHEQAMISLRQHTETLVKALPKPGQLVVIGGDTLLGLCQAAATQALLTHPSIQPGWGCARLLGGIWDGVPCYSRSGAFGAEDDLASLYLKLNTLQ